MFTENKLEEESDLDDNKDKASYKQFVDHFHVKQATLMKYKQLGFLKVFSLK